MLIKFDFLFLPFKSFFLNLVVDIMQQAVIEKFNLCEDNLSGLLRWIGQIEQKIASVGGPKEYIDELRNQINLLKVSLFYDFSSIVILKIFCY